MELLSIETRPIPFTTILCFFKKFQVVEIRAILLMFARGWQKNMYKLLSIPYMPGSMIYGYSTPPKFSALFLSYEVATSISECTLMVTSLA